jgi:hypothetical protein
MKGAIGGACSVHCISAYSILGWKSQGKRSLVRSRCRRENNIKMDIREMGL